MFKKYFFLFLSFSFFFLIDFFICSYYPSISIENTEIFIINLFLFSLTLGFFIVINVLQKRKKTPIFTYLSLSFLKMILSLFFLYPKITEESHNFLPYILHFFFFYFAYLSVEIFLLKKDSR